MLIGFGDLLLTSTGFGYDVDFNVLLSLSLISAQVFERWGLWLAFTTVDPDISEGFLKLKQIDTKYIATLTQPFHSNLSYCGYLTGRSQA
jgi:hypothetical protein